MKASLQTLFFFMLITQICLGQWYQQSSETTQNLNGVFFIDANNGLAIGDSGTVIKTINGGTSWTPVVTGITYDFNAMDFTDANNGWAVTGIMGLYTIPDSSNVLYTTDGGTTWTSQLVLPLTNLHDITFVDAHNGWVVGWNWTFGSIILRTTNGGTTWTQIPNILEYSNKVIFVDANNGWIISPSIGSYESSSIFKTTDEGNTWALQLEICQMGEESASLNDVVFLDLNNGIAVGRYSQTVLGGHALIVNTTDGGVNWTQISLFNASMLNGVFFSSAMEVITVGEGGIIYRTNDGGNSWAEQISGTTNALNNVYFVDSVNGWTVGDNGTILHTTNGGVSFVEEEPPGEAPTEFLLSQNYPNPFNPSTKIKYSVPQTSQVQIKVFDVLGDEIETLVNEEKPGGTFELTWYAEELPSGVYFYQLKATPNGGQAGDPSTGSGRVFIETKKIVLVK